MFNKHHIIRYLQARHLSDGGYFFARVIPSAGMDTLLALKTLQMLESSQIPRLDIIRFFTNEDAERNLNSLAALYFAVSSFAALKEPLSNFEKYKPFIESVATNSEVFKPKQFKLKQTKSFALFDASVNTVYLDVVEGEAKTAFYLASLCKAFAIKEHTKEITAFIKQLQNSDGGFGTIKGSELSTTYYATQALRLLKQEIPHHEQVTTYLHQQIEQVNYLEEYFWAVESLTGLKANIPNKQRILSFLIACHKGNGGFARSQFMGIANIEQTYQAVSLLKIFEKYDLPVFEEITS